MKETRKKKAICSRYGKIYYGHSAISRKDNVTQICPDCGTREALESIGVDKKEQEQILNIIHTCYSRQLSEIEQVKRKETNKRRMVGTDGVAEGRKLI